MSKSTFASWFIRSLVILSFFSSISFSIPSFAGPNSGLNSGQIVGLKCGGIFKGQPLNDPKSQMQSVFDRVNESITERGFISSQPPLNAELAAEAGHLGLMWWGLRIYIAKSVEAARAHFESEPILLMRGLYLIGEIPIGKTSVEASVETGGESPTNVSNVPAPEVFSKLISNGLYTFENGQAKKIATKFVDEEFSPGGLIWILGESQGPFLYQTGWAFPKNRGVVLFKDGQESTTYKKVRRLANQLIKKGFRITFNTDFIGALDKVRDQKRKEGSVWIPKSRYLDDPDLYKATLESYHLGHRFSVEVWNEKNQLVGGIIGNKEGSLYSPDSTFYDFENYPGVSIGFAKIAMVALMDRLNAAGIPFVDAGMVTPFTALMKGRLIPSSEFKNLIQQLPENTSVDFSHPWTAQ